MATTALRFRVPGYLINGEISKLINRGYQQVLKTSKTEIAATAEHLKALQQFTEELKEALNLPSLYNESLGRSARLISMTASRIAIRLRVIGRNGLGEGAGCG